MDYNKSKKVDWAYLFTVPNILCYFRIVLIAPMLIFFFIARNNDYAEKYTISAAACAFGSERLFRRYACP